MTHTRVQRDIRERGTGERDRDRDRDRQTETDRERQRQNDRDRERHTERVKQHSATNTDTQSHALSLTVSDAGYLDLNVLVGAEEVAEGQFFWNDGTPLTLKTSLWRHPSEGFNRGLNCVSVSSTKRLIDITCFKSAFVCQYDV